MNLQDNLIQLRKQKGFSQEELAYQLGVSRQSVSKWEAGISLPELDRLIEIADLYKVSLDELIRGDTPTKQEYYISDEQLSRVVRKSREYEFGLPIVHINIGRGPKVAKGIFAVGNIAIGVFSFGGLSFGVIGAGGIGFGLLSLAGMALGALAIGGVAIGYFAIGGLALGIYTTGGVAIASHIAIGGKAIGHVAIGASPSGEHIVQTSAYVTSREVYDAICSLPVSIPEWLNNLLSFMK